MLPWAGGHILQHDTGLVQHFATDGYTASLFLYEYIET
jgi:hypothetical protein